MLQLLTKMNAFVFGTIKVLLGNDLSFWVNFVGKLHKLSCHGITFLLSVAITSCTRFSSMSISNKFDT